MSPSRAVLITGCSTGIGAATARRLHRAGYPVYATARRTKDLAGLAALGITTMPLDVTDEESIQVPVKRVIDEHGAVGTLVNNAGYGVLGALEEVSLDAVRAQFETNLLGALRLCQLVLPGMRRQGWGRIVNVSSILGRAAQPGSGAYESSKYALEGLSDAMRLEVAPFGVRVVLIEPGPVRTPFAATARRQIGTSDVYEDFHRRLGAWFDGVYGPGRPNLVGRFTIDADAVAKVIERAVRARRPRARYPAGTLAKGFLTMRRMLPDRPFDGFVRAQFPIPRRDSGD